tara:strand:+ start:68 stop:535 length:468 start_codon:yes stop_codon:yes gene_type:complete
MKLFLTTLIFLITFFSVSFDYIEDGHFTLSLKSQKLPSKKKFTLYENKGSWTNNYGNYGTFFCYGSIQSVTKSFEGLLVICEHLDSDDEKFWVLYERSNDGDEGGSGKATYIEGLGKWKNFKGTKCIFATKYKGSSGFSKKKCKLTENLHKELQK